MLISACQCDVLTDAEEFIFFFASLKHSGILLPLYWLIQLSNWPLKIKNNNLKKQTKKRKNIKKKKKKRCVRNMRPVKQDGKEKAGKGVPFLISSTCNIGHAVWCLPEWSECVHLSEVVAKGEWKKKKTILLKTWRSAVEHEADFCELKACQWQVSPLLKGWIPTHLLDSRIKICGNNSFSSWKSWCKQKERYVTVVSGSTKKENQCVEVSSLKPYIANVKEWSFPKTFSKLKLTGVELDQQDMI